MSVVQIFNSFNVIKNILEKNEFNFGKKKINEMKNLFTITNELLIKNVVVKNEDVKNINCKKVKSDYFSMVTPNVTEKILKKYFGEDVGNFINEYEKLYRQFNEYTKTNKDFSYTENLIKSNSVIVKENVYDCIISEEEFDDFKKRLEEEDTFF